MLCNAHKNLPRERGEKIAESCLIMSASLDVLRIGHRCDRVTTHGSNGLRRHGDQHQEECLQAGQRERQEETTRTTLCSLSSLVSP
jgi:hypothetical protein